MRTATGLDKRAAEPNQNELKLDLFYSKYFDRDFYIRSNPDVVAGKIDPLTHYKTYGWRERRNPNPYFSVDWYLSRYSDVEQAAVEPLHHFLIAGILENRQPHHLIDLRHYVNTTPDLQATQGDPYFHFIRYGDSEGRSPHPLFDYAFYLGAAGDLRGMAPFSHYSEIGARKLISPCPAFDPAHYLQNYPDAAASGQEPILHYLLSQTGVRRHFHPLLDAAQQRETSLRARDGLDPLEDYIRYRSHFNPGDKARGATTIPKPRQSFVEQCESDRPLFEEPKVSVIMPICGAPEIHLSACVNSILLQTYQNWELILVDSGSSDKARLAIQHNQERDQRIASFRLEDNLGVSEASNAGVKAATGDYVAIVDPGDVLMPTALASLMARIVHDRADAAYSDQAYRTGSNAANEFLLKPDWSPTLLCGAMYVGQLLLLRRETAIAAGLFNKAYDGCQDYELMLRVSEITSRISHVPQILCHRRRRTEGSAEPDPAVDGEIRIKQATAVNAHFARIGLAGEAEINEGTPHRLSITPRSRLAAEVEIDVISEGVDGCLALRSTLESAGVVVRSMRSYGSDVSEALADPRRAPYLLFMHSGLQILDARWIAHLVMHAQFDDVGFVAPHLYNRDDKVVAADLIVNAQEGLIPAQEGTSFGEDGYPASLACDREVSAVRGLCAIVRSDLLEAFGGISPAYCSLHGAVAEASFRASRAGFRNIVVAAKYLRLPQNLSLYSTLTEIDRQLFIEEHWDELACGDPFYNPRSSRNAVYRLDHF